LKIKLLLQKKVQVSETVKKKRSKNTAAIADLKSANVEKITAAIKSFHTTGAAEIVLPVIELWNNNPSVEIEKQIKELIESLKDSSTVEPLIDAYRNPEFQGLKRKMTTAFWNSKLDFTPFVSDFVLFAIEGDFQDAFEALTLIEQFETSLSESSIMECQLLLKEYFGTEDKLDEQKDVILADLALFLKKSDEESELDDFYFE
jgi:hypothetical protein